MTARERARLAEVNPVSSRDTSGGEGDHSIVSRVLIIAILLFLALASSVLVSEGLAMGVGHGRGLRQGRVLDRRDLRRVRFRFAVGVIVFAIVLWTVFGILTHAW